MLFPRDIDDYRERDLDLVAEAYEQRRAWSRATRCQCPGEMPGRCPGPAYCPMCQSDPVLAEVAAGTEVPDAPDDDVAGGGLRTAPTWMEPVWYRGFRIYYDRTPVAGNDWHYVHDDYDGADDAGDNRAGSEATLEACKTEIDEQFFDGEPEATARKES